MGAGHPPTQLQGILGDLHPDQARRHHDMTALIRTSRWCRTKFRLLQTATLCLTAGMLLTITAGVVSLAH